MVLITIGMTGDFEDGKKKVVVGGGIGKDWQTFFS